MAKFEGNVEVFRYTPSGADVSPNQIVTVGNLIGVSRGKIKDGETGTVFMTSKKSIYSFQLATIDSAISRGTYATKDSSGKVKAASAGDTIIGIFWEAAATTDTEAIIMLADVGTTYGTAAATTTAAGLMSAADKTKLDGIGIATTTTAGLVKPDGTTITVTEAGVIATAGG